MTTETSNGAIIALEIGIFVASVVAAIVGFFIVRTLNNIDYNQKEFSETIKDFKSDIYSRVNGLECKFNHLLGQHDINHKRRKEDQI